MCELMTVAVADDEAEARAAIRECLERYTAEHDDIRLEIREYASGEQLLASYRSDVDVILLDVEMNGLDGFETAHAIRDRDGNVALLFVTNMTQYAIRGYEVGAMNYLLKPVNYYALAREIGRCVAAKRAGRGDDSLMLSTASGMVRVPMPTIIYLECIRHKIIVHTLEGLYEFTGTIKSFLPQLEPHGFVMANSCYLVNMRYATAIDQTDCVLRDGTRLAISRRRRAGLLQSLAAYFGTVA